MKDEGSGISKDPRSSHGGSRQSVNPGIGCMIRAASSNVERTRGCAKSNSNGSRKGGRVSTISEGSGNSGVGVAVLPGLHKS